MKFYAISTFFLLSLLGTSLASADDNRVLLLGDSNMAGTFGKQLKAALEDEGFEVKRRAKCGSGLAYPGFFDWLEKAPALAERFDAGTVVLIFGGNDAQSLKPRKGDVWRRKIHWDDEHEWRDTYRDRIARLADRLAQSGRKLVVLSPTNRRPKRASERMVRIMEEQRAAVADAPNAEWVNTFEASSDHDGRYLAHGLADGGRRKSFRRRDGIHLTAAGAQALVARLIPTLRQVLHATARRF